MIMQWKTFNQNFKCSGLAILKLPLWELSQAHWVFLSHIPTVLQQFEVFKKISEIFNLASKIFEWTVNYPNFSQNSTAFLRENTWATSYFTAEYGFGVQLQPLLQSLRQPSGHVTCEETQYWPAGASLQGWGDKGCCFPGCSAALWFHSHAGTSSCMAVRGSKHPLTCFPGIGVIEQDRS